MKQTTQKKSRKKKNPLFVVTNKGQDVEMATHYGEALLKLLGLENAWKFLMDILCDVLKSVKSYPMVVAIKEWLDDVLEKLMATFSAVLS